METSHGMVYKIGFSPDEYVMTPGSIRDEKQSAKPPTPTDITLF